MEDLVAVTFSDNPFLLLYLFFLCDVPVPDFPLRAYRFHSIVKEKYVVNVKNI